MTAGKSLLIVDDEKHIRSVFMRVLSFVVPECKVEIAVNGAEAVNMFREGRHNVILMDLHMPVKDGMSAFREIEQICKEEKIKVPAVIFCTGYEPPEDLARMVKKSPRHCILRKPVSTDTLMNEIKSRF